MQPSDFDSSGTLRAVLDSVSANIAVTDHEGRIVFVNDGWARLAASEGGIDGCGVGANYLEVCRKAAGPNSIEATAVYNAMTRIISGKSDYYELEYPCDSETIERWFVVRITPLKGSQPRGLVIMHSNVTSIRLIHQREEEQSREQTRQAQQASETRGLEGLTEPPLKGIAARNVGIEPLRTSNIELFHHLSELYGALLDKAVRHRLNNEKSDVSPESRRLAEAMGRFRVVPRDLIEIHLAVLKPRFAGSNPPRQQLYAEEARILVLELMGNLAYYYQKMGTGRAAPWPAKENNRE